MAVVREAAGQLAVEYPVTLTGNGTASATPTPTPGGAPLRAMADGARSRPARRRSAAA